jgi:hypothetical protein
MSDPRDDLVDEVSQRQESAGWTLLRNCPCCGANPRILFFDNTVTVVCSDMGCRHIEASNIDDATKLWNEPRFTDK